MCFMGSWDDASKRGIGGSTAYKVFMVLDTAKRRVKDEQSKKVLNDICEAIAAQFRDGSSAGSR